MSTRFVVTSTFVVLSLASAVGATTDMAIWGFQPPNTPADITNNGTGPSVTADTGVFAGTSTATGLHASANTDWTTPAGNGSSDSLNANEWGIGDYFQFSTSTLGHYGIEVLWDQTRSSTGATTFDLLGSTDGVNFTTLLLDDYAVLLNDAANGGTWTTAGPRVVNYQFGPIVLPAAFDNQPTVAFRLVAQVAGTATGGTGRVDNVTVRAVPSPGALALFGLGALVLRRRR